MHFISLPIIFCLLSGILLAIMNDFNGILAKQTSPLFSSWVAHGVGALTAIIILFFLYLHNKKNSVHKTKNAQLNILQNKQLIFLYFGGIIGAFTVIFSSIAINSVIGLSGTLSLMLLGQVTFGIFSDIFGIFGIPKKKFHRNDLVVISSILIGSWLIIFCR